MIYRISFFDNNRHQAAATRESINSYARHAVPYGHGRQAGATIEGILPYARHAISYGHGRQAVARTEGRIPYARHAVRDSNGRQAAAIREGIIPYVRHAAVVRYYACIATSNQRLACGFYQTISIAMIYRISFFDNNRHQAGAIQEGIIPYARHAIPYDNGRQARATVEGLIPYAHHAVGDNKFSKGRIYIHECAINCHVIANQFCCDTCGGRRITVNRIP